MSTKVVNCGREQFDVYIGRGSMWANPFSHLPLEQSQAEVQTTTRAEAIARYEEWLMTRPRLLASLPRLKDKTLGCWCKPQPCHGDILARLADAEPHSDERRPRQKR